MTGALACGEQTSPGRASPDAGTAVPGVVLPETSVVGMIGVGDMGSTGRPGRWRGLASLTRRSAGVPRRRGAWPADCLGGRG